MNKLTYTLIIYLISIQFTHAQFWEQIDVPDTVQVRSVFIVSNGVVFIGGQNHIYSSVDNCLTWQHSLTTNQLNISFAENSENRIATNSLYYSDNWGNLWYYFGDNELPISTGSVFFNSNNYLFAGDWGSIYKISPNFEIISTVCSTQGASVNDLAETSNGNLYACTWDFLHYLENGVYRSNDGGDNWEFIDIADDGFTALAVNSDDEIFAASPYEGLFISDDYGDTWIQKPGYNIYDLFIDNNNVLYAASSEYGVHRSFNNGDSWEDVSSGMGNTGNQFALATNGHLYCRGGYSLFRTVEPITVPEVEEIKNIKIYPNPSNGIFTIENLQAIEKTCSISITDITGKEIYKSQVSDNTTQIDISKQSSGIYFIKLYQDNILIETQKIIIN